MVKEFLGFREKKRRIDRRLIGRKRGKEGGEREEKDYLFPYSQ